MTRYEGNPPDYDGPAVDIEFDPRDPPLGFEDDPDEYDDAGDDDFDCSLMADGYCGAAGSEYCDFECPNRS